MVMKPLDTGWIRIRIRIGIHPKCWIGFGINDSGSETLH
jgi:hypothetical protein